MPDLHPFDAVIFDLDGTLIDSERLVVDAGVLALGRLGLPPRRDVLLSMVGTVGDAELQVLQAAFGPAFDWDAFEAEWSLALGGAFDGPIPQRPGAEALLSRLRDLRLPVAVATNSTTASARRNLRGAGLLPLIGEARVFGRDQVDRPKPAPDLFLMAAAVLEVVPARCLVFEDSDPGVAAALAAGMTVVHVPDQRPPAQPAAAHLVARTLAEGARAIGLVAAQPDEVPARQARP
jgi:beta-phosphoglucomutase-like phosphatase (HAD superfamily)